MPIRGMPSGGAPVLAMNSATIKPELMPELLAAAFNEAVCPYMEKIEQLKGQRANQPD